MERNADFCHSSLAPEGGSIAWNPLNGPGPLGDDMAQLSEGGRTLRPF
jgi:hypothetical protein